MTSAPSDDPAYVIPRLRWRNIARLVGGLLPLVLFITVGSLFALPTASDELVHYVWLFGVTSWFVIAACALYLSLVPCPKCGKRFHVAPDSTHWNHFASKCMNCGISIRAKALQ